MVCRAALILGLVWGLQGSGSFVQRRPWDLGLIPIGWTFAGPLHSPPRKSCTR